MDGVSGRKRVFTLLILIVALSPAWAVENGLQGITVCVYPLADFSPEGGAADRQKALTDAVTLEVQGAGLTVIPREQWEPTAKKLGLGTRELQETPAAIELADASGAAIAVSGFFSIEADKILVSISCYDAKGRALAGGLMRQWRYTLSIYNSLHEAIDGMLSGITLSSSAVTAAVSPSTQRIPISRITFTSAQNGMEVSLSGDKSIGTIQDGKLIYADAGVLSGTPLLIEKKQNGYHTAWQTVPARGEIALSPLVKKTAFAIEAVWTTGQLVGAGAALRWYPLPDTLFTSFSLYPFVQLPPQGTTASSFTLHIDTSLGIGGYVFFPADSPFRLGLSTGFGAVFTALFGSSTPLYTDFYFDVVNVWVEWNLPRLSFFIRSEAKYTLGIGTNLLGMNIMNTSYLPPLTLGAVVKL